MTAATPPGASTELLVHNPANGQLVDRVPIATPDEVRAAVARARKAQADWAARSIEDRCAVLRNVRERLLARTDDMVDVLVREHGKPRQEALMHEVMSHLELLTYFTGEAERILAPSPIPLRLLKHSSPATRWCSSRRSSPRSTPAWAARSTSKPGSRPTCSRWCTAGATSARPSSSPAWT